WLCFVGEEEGERLAFHYPHPHALPRAGFDEGLALEGMLDYRSWFPHGMGPAEEGPLRDDRWAWADGATPPEPDEVFVRLAHALDGGAA
ncbi:DUF5639 domain-containing protein, partial [Oceanithermus sp.]